MSTFKEHRTIADRSASDRRRHKKKIEDAIKDGVHSIVADESIIGQDGKKKIRIPILNMPELVYLNISKKCKKNTKIGLLATETTIKTRIYNKSLRQKYKLLVPSKKLQVNHVNKSIRYVKMGKTKEAEKALKPAVNYLIKNKCKKIILGCTELPIAIFAYKSFKKAKISKTFLDPNLILAEASMRRYKVKWLWLDT